MNEDMFREIYKLNIPEAIQDALYAILSLKNNSSAFLWIQFGILWEWSIKQEWWEDFITAMSLRNCIPEKNTLVIKDMLIAEISPEKFSNAIYEFLKARNNG